jgi:aminopeptidase-like protein
MLSKSNFLNHGIRFILCPENIGAVSYLSKHGQELKRKVVAGYVINCVGNGFKWTYKRSRQHNSLADSAVLNSLLKNQLPLEVVDFFPDGSDERQYCSPGFNLPVGLLMRSMYGRFPEYHTSADNLSFFEVEAVFESANAYFDAIMTAELNFIPLSAVQFGTPQLSKSLISIYPESMNFQAKPKSMDVRFTLELINLAEGKEDLLSICEKKGYRLLDYVEVIRNLLKAGYIKEVIK